MMDPATWAIVIGAILAVAVYYKMRSNLLAWGVAAIVLGAGLFAPVWVNDLFEGEPITPVATTAYASFDIDMVNGSWNDGNATGTLSSDEKTITFVLDARTTPDDFNKDHCSVNFTINPIAPLGAKNDELITIHFRANEETKYSGEYIFAETGDDYECDWRINAESDDDDGVASLTMLYTENPWVELRFELSGGTDSLGAEMQTVGESMSFPVTFTCGSWSETFTVTLIVTETS